MMAILRGLDGKFYELPDDKVKSFEVPREKVKALLEKHGLPVQQGRSGPGAGRGGPSHGGPVVVQIYTPSGGYGPSHGGEHHPEGGEVDPYYWWWNNWGNY
jgi:hypothetical protein